MFRFKTMAVAGLVMTAVACGGAGNKPKVLDPTDKSGKKDRRGQEVSKAAAASFDAGLDMFVEHEKKSDWSSESCTAVAEQFIQASKEQKSDTNRQLPEAIYNAGLAHQRCGNDVKAREYFEQAQQADSSFHRARAQLVLYDFQKSKDIDGTISRLDQIIRDAKFQNQEALVSLAALQMERGSDSPDQDGKDDLERAKKNLQRALAIDDGYMPAFNQLAIYYLEQAKANAAEKGTKRKRRGGLEVAGAKKAQVNEQQLDLAALVASQAIRKNPNYAPIHNTAGLIAVELRNFNSAVKSFGTARRLDPKFFEAHMNYAAVNLSFRGFDEAEKAYRDALKLSPKEYDAHLGLALALRGQINDSNFDAKVAEAEKHLKMAKQIAPDRPETYYNEAILTQEYKAKGSQDKAIPALELAVKQYRDFIAKAGSDPLFAEAVKRSEERSQDIEDTVTFIREGEAAKKAEEEAMAAAKAQEKAAAEEAAKGKTAPPPAPGGAAPPAAGAAKAKK